MNSTFRPCPDPLPGGGRSILDRKIEGHKLTPVQLARVSDQYLQAKNRVIERCLSSVRPEDSASEVKPGTRCECRDAKCAESTGHVGPDWGACLHDAVRLVTVMERVMPIFRPGTPDGRIERNREVPMCAACAEHHEAKAGAR